MVLTWDLAFWLAPAMGLQNRAVPWLPLDRCLGQGRQGSLTGFAAWARVARTVLLLPPKVVLGTGAH